MRNKKVNKSKDSGTSSSGAHDKSKHNKSEHSSIVPDVNFIRSQYMVTRIRFQLLGAWIVCLMLPLVMWLWSTPSLLARPLIFNSVIGATIAIIIGYNMWRRIDRYATVEASAYIFWSFVPAFLIVIFFFMMFRLEYNRYIFFTSMVLSQFWFLLIHYWSSQVLNFVFGIIEGGNLGSMKDQKHRQFITLNKSASEGLPKDLTLSGVVADLRYNHEPEWETFMANLTLAGVPVYHYKQIEEDFSGQVSIEHPSENSFGSLLPHLTYLKIKQYLDIFWIILALPILIPLCCITAIAILATNGGPVIYKQKRMGFRAQPFYAYKFRTMNNNIISGHSLENTAMTVENDPRITPIGRFLRKYRIDELPQVVNILKGEMSWIGPRPEAIELSKMYEAELPYYRYRHAVRPGITGWAQVNQGHVTTVGDVHEKLKYDFYFIKNISIWMDFLIILKTFQTVFSGFGSK